MGKNKDKQEYYIYNELDELEDVIVLSKKELLAYKRKSPGYIIEPVGTDYNLSNED